jgi:hypothetical protein
LSFIVKKTFFKLFIMMNVILMSYLSSWAQFVKVECLFIKAPFHRSGFSSNGLFIKCTISSNFQNCKQNFCSTSTSKVIDDEQAIWWTAASMKSRLDEKILRWKGTPPFVKCYTLIYIPLLGPPDCLQYINNNMGTITR